MEKRPLPDRQREWLETELQHWLASGWVTAEQLTLIQDSYQSKADVSRQKQSRGVFVLQAIAMGLISLAIMLLIGFNWQEIPGAIRILIVLGSMLAAHAVGFWLRWTKQKPLASEMAFFLGSFLYGCGIWQIGQVFNINSQNADGIWLWGIGVLPLAILLESTLLHALVVAILALWVGQEMLGWASSRTWWGWFRFPSACYSLPLLVTPGIIGAYRKNATRILALYLPLVAWWLVLLPFAWNRDIHPIYFIGTVAALFLALSEAHRVGSPMAIPFRRFGTLGTAVILFLLNFLDIMRDLMRHRGLELKMIQGLAILCVGLGCIAALNHWGTRRPEDPPGLLQRLWQRYWLPTGLILIYAGLSVWTGLLGDNVTSSGYRYPYDDSFSLWSLSLVVPILFTNVATVALAIWLLKVGMREDRGRPFSGGVLLFLSWAIARYVDLFGGVGGMLGAAIMFLLCGVGLFALARYWSQRKESLP